MGNKNNWRARAVCHGVPEESYSASTWECLPKLQTFIEDYCMFCPVAQECLDDSWSPTPNGVGTTDDMFWVVRGGYIPTSQALNPRGRPRSQPEMPVTLGQGQRAIGPNGFVMCGKNEHEMDGVNTIVEGGRKRCRACKNAYKKKSHPLKKKCTQGHEWTEDNWEMTSAGKRRCLTCAEHRSNGMCSSGLHEMVKGNVFSTRRGKFCKACFDAKAANVPTLRDATIEE